MEFENLRRKKFENLRRKIFGLSLKKRPPSFWYNEGLASQVLAPLNSLALVATVLRRVASKYVFVPNGVCVGSLCLGGAGKTTVAMHIASTLGDDVIYCTSGYGGGKDGVFASARGSFGERMEKFDILSDESFSALMRGFDVFQSRRREKVLDFCRPVVFDDAFSYTRIRCEENILVFASGCFGNGLVQPFGPLREHYIAILWADRILFENERDTSKARAKVQRLAQKLGKRVGSFRRYVSDLLYLKVRGGKWEIDTAKKDSVSGGKALLVSAIAIPESFEKTAWNMGIRWETHIKFPDHFRFSKEHLELFEVCGSYDFILTTEKDFWKFVRLAYIGAVRDSCDVFAPRISVEISDRPFT